MCGWIDIIIYNYILDIYCYKICDTVISEIINSENFV